MLSDLIKKLKKEKAKLAVLEAKVAAQMGAELAALPTAFGFTDAPSFIKAIKTAAGKRRGRKPGKVQTKPTRRKKRAVITDATRARVKKLANEGKTGAEIAAAVGISLPSVQNIKKALGLVKAKK